MRSANEIRSTISTPLSAPDILYKDFLRLTSRKHESQPAVSCHSENENMFRQLNPATVSELKQIEVNEMYFEELHYADLASSYSVIVFSDVFLSSADEQLRAHSSASRHVGLRGILLSEIIQPVRQIFSDLLRCN